MFLNFNKLKQPEGVELVTTFTKATNRCPCSARGTSGTLQIGDDVPYDSMKPPIKMSQNAM